MSERYAALVQPWQPAFRHSAGRLGSHFIRASRDRQLLGWKTARLGVTIPPIDTGEPGEWVEVGPGATLIGCAAATGPASGGDGPGRFFAAVTVDGADTPLYALVACTDPSTLSAGMRLKANFAMAAESGFFMPMFEPAVAVQ